jgi:uncharacterized protein involved in response to NO
MNTEAAESSEMAVEKAAAQTQNASLSHAGSEPFRLFFPAGVLAGIIGVALWPLHFAKVIALYPGLAHAHIMGYGLFGAFIFGFLGTALPRLLSAPPLGVRNVLVLLGLHLAMVVSFAIQKIFWGDALFLGLLLLFLLLMARRVRHRQDTPPPGFVLVGMAFLCVLAGAIIGVLQPWMEDAAAYWVPMQRRLAYQGFILLPILGIGPFLLPRFLGLASGHNFPETLSPSPAWKRKAGLAAATGAVIIASFFIEAEGWLRAAYALRFAAALGYLLLEFPLRAGPTLRNPMGACLHISLVAVVCGFLLVAAFPAYRVALLHLTLVGGFAVISFTVATRVLFGHSGNLAKLKERNRWLLVVVGLMLFGMATRISGDFWPKIMASHYSYGAIVWIIAVLLWSWHALPKVLQADRE